MDLDVHDGFITPVNVFEIIGVYIKNGFGCLGSLYPYHECQDSIVLVFEWE